MKNIFVAALYCAVFAVVLIVTHFVHMRAFAVNVVLFAATADALIATAVTAVIFWLSGHGRAFTGLEHVQLVAIWLLGGYAFAVSVPTVIDRSLSFYILEKLQQRGGSIATAGFDDIFRIEYLAEHRLVEVRLTEQLEAGTISINNGCVRLTPKGDRLAKFSRMYRAYFLPRQRLLMGQYTDALVDPFRNRPLSADQGCK